MVIETNRRIEPEVRRTDTSPSMPVRWTFVNVLWSGFYKPSGPPDLTNCSAHNRFSRSIHWLIPEAQTNIFPRTALQTSEAAAGIPL